MVESNKEIPTIKDVAKQAGVSVATVSRALNGNQRVSAETRKKIQQIAKDMGYHPNLIARSVRMKKTSIIGVVISTVTASFFTEVIDSLTELAEDNDYQLIIARTNENPKNEKKAVEVLTQQMVDGLIIATTGHEIDYTNIVNRFPTVFIDRMPTNVNSSKFDAVVVNNEDGTKKLVSFMIKFGASQIGIINSEVTATQNQRLNGYKKALQVNAIPIDESLIKKSQVDYSDVEGLTSQLLFNLRCDAIVATDNEILQRVLKRTYERNIKDIQIGCFDYSPWMQFIRYPIVVAAQPTVQIGKVAFKLLMQRIKNPDKAQEIRELNTTIKIKTK